MQITISPETHKLLEEQMKKHGLASPDDAVRVALEHLGPRNVGTIEALDPETQAAIDEGWNQSEREAGRPWEAVREEIRNRFIRK